MDRILFGQLGANGDCLYATILARQLRLDYPKAEITWAISSQCTHLLRNNPYIDHVWEIPVFDWSHHEMLWRVFEREAIRRYQRRDFDGMVLSQIWPNNFHNYDGTVRSSLLRAYGRRLTVPIENVIHLADDEIDRVESFAERARLAEIEHKILFECSSKSGQSFVTPDKAQDIADELYRIMPQARVIFSTHLPMELRDKRSRHAGSLSLREIARLTHHVDLFVGAGSGGTVSASSSAARIVPMIQLLAASTSVFASFAHDFEYFGLTERPVLEMTAEDPVLIARSIVAALSNGIEAARAEFDGRIPVRFDHYFSQVTGCLIRQHRYLDTARSLMITAERYGWTREIVGFAREHVLPHLANDPSWFFAPSRRIAERFEAELAAAGAGHDTPLLNRRWADGSAFLKPAFDDTRRATARV